MKKEDLFKALVVVEYVAFVIATLLVIIFQFIGKGSIITVALAMYVVAFALCCFENVILCVELFKDKNNAIKTEVSGLEIASEQGEKIVKKSVKNEIKLQKIKTITMTIISGLVAIFTLVVLILF